MNVHTLLADATSSLDTTVEPATAEADLVRGRRALGHRRARRGGLAAVVAAGALAGAVVLSGTTEPPGTPVAGSSSSALQVGGITLVDYTGEQPVGFTVDVVPDGWVLEGADDAALVIGPVHATTVEDSLRDRLAVLLMSQDAVVPTDGMPVRVGAADGMLTADGGGVPGTVNEYTTDPRDTILYYVDAASGQPVTVQVPGALGWSTDQITDFAEGVHITDAAVRGVG